MSSNHLSTNGTMFSFSQTLVDTCWSNCGINHYIMPLGVNFICDVCITTDGACVCSKPVYSTAGLSHNSRIAMSCRRDNPLGNKDFFTNRTVRSFPNGLYTDCIYHYDTAGDEPLAREHYRILVTTVLQEPVGLIYVDALTGEVFGMKVVEKTNK